MSDNNASLLPNISINEQTLVDFIEIGIVQYLPLIQNLGPVTYLDFSNLDPSTIGASSGGGSGNAGNLVISNLVNYTASNIIVPANSSHVIDISANTPAWYMAYNLKVTPSDTQAYYTVSIYNGDASQSSVLNDKSNLFYLSVNNLGEFSDSTPFTINGTSNVKSIVISNNSNVSNTFNVTLVATRYDVPTTTVMI